MYIIACVQGKGSVSSEHFAEETPNYSMYSFGSEIVQEQCILPILVHSNRRLTTVQPPPPTCPVVAVTCVIAPRGNVGAWVYLCNAQVLASTFLWLLAQGLHRRAETQSNPHYQPSLSSSLDYAST